MSPTSYALKADSHPLAFGRALKDQRSRPSCAAGVHIKVSFGGSFGKFDEMYIVTYLASLVVYIGVARLFARACVLYLLGYTSRVYRESIREVVTVDGVHSKKAAEALIAANAFAALKRVAQERQAAAGNTGAPYWRQTVLDELKEAGLTDGDARGVAQIVAPYGAIDFQKFVDRAATLNTLGVNDIATVVVKSEATKMGAEAAPTLKATV